MRPGQRGRPAAAPSASAAVPAFPDNVVVFPDRDFITIEGYQDHVGETATWSRSTAAARSSARPRAWSSRATWPSRSTTPAATAGAPAPASRSPRTSGAATSPRSGFPDGDDRGHDGRHGSAAKVHAARRRHHAHRHRAPGAAEAASGQVEQRIVNPDLVAPRGQARRPCPAGTADAGARGGYSSGLAVAGNSDFVATYVFDDRSSSERPRPAPAASG